MAQDEKRALWYIKKIPLFQDVSHDTIHKLVQCVELKEVRRRQVVYLPGDPGQAVYFVNGGRVKWLNEPDKALTTDVPKVTPVPYKVMQVNLELRAFVPQVFEASRSREWNLVDVRSSDEFTGKVIAPPGMTETAQRGGHIPGAKSIPWSTAVNPDGTFRAADDLMRIYCQEKGVDPKKDTIAYCRIGERSSHTWFVLKYLIGINNVKNYDGSWTEYGNLVAAPIEKS